MIKSIVRTGLAINNNRTLVDVAIKVGEETGEVLGEVSKISGHTKYKDVEKSELAHEIADAIISLVDLGYVHYGISFPQILEQSVDTKLKKWFNKYKQTIK